MARRPSQGGDVGSSPIFEAIYNPDILDTLFLHFDNTNPDGRNDLGHFSLVCKSFKGPALRRLWAILDSYVPLLNILPQLEEINDEFYFYGRLAGSAFDEYANLVRVLRLGAVGNRGRNFSGQVFSRLAKELNGSPLLPSLRRVTIQALDAVTVTFIPLLFHLHLHSLEYSPQETDETQLHRLVFPSLKDYCWDLRKLAITINDTGSTFPTLILDSIFGLKRLKKLEIRTAFSMVFSPTDFARLGANCPELTTLHLDISFDHAHGCPVATEASAEVFSHLEVLHLTVRNASTYHVDANYSIALCSSWPKYLITKLTSLTLIISTVFYSYDRLLTALSQAPRFRRLEFGQNPDTPINIYPADIVQSFLIPTLSEVVWDVYTLTTPSSSQNLIALQEIVEAGFISASCPRSLRILVLPFQMPHPFSMKTLRYIADNAIGLESLSICVESSLDFNPNEPPGPINPNLASPSTLRHLHICDQRASKTFHPTEYRYLAEYLDTIFPNLESLGVCKDSRGDGGYHEAHWDHIDHLRKKEKLIRALLK